MAASATDNLKLKVQDTLARLTPGQKIGLGAAVLTIVIGGFVLTRMGGTAEMSPLYTDLSSTDASEIVDELSSRGVSYELTDAGHTVLVPKTDVYDLRVALSGAGLPASNEGYALLDQQGITTSEFRQRIDFQRALEGELSQTLRAMEGVSSATVHLALPEESVFVDEPSRPTASVLISSRGLEQIDGGQVEAIVHLVASSVKNMQPADVTVIGAEGQVLSTAGQMAGSGGTARAKIENAFEQNLSATITSMLGRVTGAGKAAVTVSADLDLSERELTTEAYEPATDVDGNSQIVTERSSTETYSEDPAAGETGVLGPDGAVVEQPAAPETAGDGYEKTDIENTYALDRVVEQVRETPGTIQRLSVAVLVDEAAVTDAQIADIEAMVATAAGIDAERGDAVVITRLPFDTSATEAAEADAAAAAEAKKEADQMALYRTIAIVVLALIALLLAFFSTRRARRVHATPIELAELEGMQELPAADQHAVEAPLQTMQLPAVDDDGEAREVEHGSVAVKELSDMAEQRPEDVANVLRSWLAEPPRDKR